MAFVNEELVCERIEALETFIETFPESPLVSPMKNELEYLYSLGCVKKEN